MIHFKPPKLRVGQMLILVFLIVFAASCVQAPENKSAPEEVKASAMMVSEESDLDSYTVYKLYKERSKGLSGQALGVDLFDEFNKIYEANDVKVIGVWQNVKDPLEVYFMTAFRDDAHYESFVDNAKQDSTYLRMSKQIQEDRESIEATTLVKLK